NTLQSGPSQHLRKFRPQKSSGMDRWGHATNFPWLGTKQGFDAGRHEGHCLCTKALPLPACSSTTRLPSSLTPKNCCVFTENAVGGLASFASVPSGDISTIPSIIPSAEAFDGQKRTCTARPPELSTASPEIVPCANPF